MCANRINRVALCWMEVWKDGRIEGWKNGRMEEWKNGIITAGDERVDMMFKYDHHMIKDQTDKRCNVREQN